MINRINVHPQKLDNGSIKVTVTAEGNTYNHKETLKSYGFKWRDARMGGIDSKWWELEMVGDMADLRDKLTNIVENVPHKEYTRSA